MTEIHGGQKETLASFLACLINQSGCSSYFNFGVSRKSCAINECWFSPNANPLGAGLVWLLYYIFCFFFQHHQAKQRRSWQILLQPPNASPSQVAQSLLSLQSDQKHQRRPNRSRWGQKGLCWWGSVSHNWGEGGEWSLGWAGLGRTQLRWELKIQPEGWLCVPHRCTSVPTASTATPMSTGCGCTPWRSTRCSPCSAAPCARTCSTTRSTSSCTSPTSTAWRPTAWRSSSWR